MTAQILTEVETLLHKAAGLLAGIGHAGSAKVHALIADLKGDESSLQQEAETDATQVAHDAEAAAAPVVAETEHDAETVAEQAAADVAKAAGDAATA